MTTTIVGGIFTIVGVLLGVALTWAQQHLAARSAAKSVAAALFTQVAKAITLMEVERELFRHRREGWRPNFIALANVAVQVLAAKTSGNWTSGVASGMSGMTAWDAAEGARFTDRWVAARAEATTALIQLSLMSDGLQKACSDLGDALDAKANAEEARGRGTGKADAQVQKSLGRLRNAVCEYRG